MSAGIAIELESSVMSDDSEVANSANITTGSDNVLLTATLVAFYSGSAVINLAVAFSIHLSQYAEVATPTYWSLSFLLLVFGISGFVRVVWYPLGGYINFLFGWIHFGLWLPLIHINAQIACIRFLATYFPLWWRNVVVANVWKHVVSIESLGFYTFSSVIGTTFHVLYPFSISTGFVMIMFISVIYLLIPPSVLWPFTVN